MWSVPSCTFAIVSKGVHCGCRHGSDSQDVQGGVCLAAPVHAQAAAGAPHLHPDNVLSTLHGKGWQLVSFGAASLTCRHGTSICPYSHEVSLPPAVTADLSRCLLKPCHSLWVINEGLTAAGHVLSSIYFTGYQDVLVSLFMCNHVVKLMHSLTDN